MARSDRQCKTKNQHIKFLEDGLINNGLARIDHNNDNSKKKKWSIHDLNTIHPINPPQEEMFQSYFSGSHIIANGSAGTGKTLAGIFLALCDVLSKDSPQSKLIIVKSAVATRDIGFLPGDLSEKLEPYELPYKDILQFITGRPNAYDSMKERGLIEFMPTSFIRGLTWDDAVVIVDEVQNLTFHEINSVVTRLGENSNLIIIGDQIQTDLHKTSSDKCGMDRFLEVSRSMKEFAEIMFTTDDIVRSQFVKSWICALEATQLPA